MNTEKDQSMKLDEYQVKASETAIYPDQGGFGGLIYTALKLNGEAGEIAEKVGKLIRDNGSVVDSEQRQLLMKELGDVLWYIAMMANELGLDLSEIAKLNLAKLADRKLRGKLGGSGDTR